MLDVIKEKSISEKEFTEIYLVDSDGGIYVAVHSLIDVNNIMTSSNSVTLRKPNVNSYRFNKRYMDKELTGDKLYQIIDQFNERKITSTSFYSMLHFLMEMVERLRF